MTASSSARRTPVPARSAHVPGALRPSGPRSRRHRVDRDCLEVHFDRRAAARAGDPPSGVVTTVRVTGEVDSGNATAFSDALTCALAGSSTTVVDLREAIFFDSASVRALLDVARHAGTTGAEFRIARPPASLVRVHGICWPEVRLPVVVRPPADPGQRRGVVVALGRDGAVSVRDGA
ncbi:STAS domain-containing protein [Kineococcus sp. NUM-3379]